MKYILIANSGVRPHRVRSVSHLWEEDVTYLFDNIDTMDDAYRYAGMVLHDIIWEHPARQSGVENYMESRIRAVRSQASIWSP